MSAKKKDGPRRYVKIADKYVKDVLSGKIPACRWVKLACKRQLNDKKRFRGKKALFHFDIESAEKICRFVELLPHIKGEWANRNELLVLTPWWIFILTTVFGWLNKDGHRRFRNVTILVPRKSAKSTITAAVSLYCLCVDHEEGAEVYSTATGRDQAKIVFGIAKAMAHKKKSLLKHYGVRVNAHDLQIQKTNSIYEPLSADAGTLDGKNTHFVSFDEFAFHKTRAIYDVMVTSTGSRRQSLAWAISTAGFNLSGICYERQVYVEKILGGVEAADSGSPEFFQDESCFGIIYTIDLGLDGVEDDVWTDPKVWGKANPNLGISHFQDELARECLAAMSNAAAENNFKTKHLNVWCNSGSAWMNMTAWNKCSDPKLDINDFSGEQCWIALDMSENTDFLAKAYVFNRDGVYYAFGQVYLPELTILAADNPQYPEWEAKGYLKRMPGAGPSYDMVTEDLNADQNMFDIQEVAFDPWHMASLSLKLAGLGFPMVRFGATTGNFSEPMKTIGVLVKDGNLRHTGRLIQDWQMSNVIAKNIGIDHIRPDKQSVKSKIDWPVTLIMALARSMFAEEIGNDGSLNV